MLRQKIISSQFLSISLRLKRLPILAMLGVVLAGVASPVIIVRADSFQDQINALNAQKAVTQGQLDALQLQASSYQDAIDKLQAQINGLQAAINANTAKQHALEAQIAAAEAKLEEQRAGLSQDLKAMYVGGQMSAVEMLATSKSLSDYVNAETYSSAVQNKIQATLDEIKALQARLKDQKAQVEELLAEQQQQKSQLDAAQAQQQRLLAMNEGQQATYNQQIRDANSQIADLRRQQLLANQSLGGQVVAGDPNHGGYPSYLANAAQDSLVDPWGMLNRECVSYTAWKVYETYGSMPYWGGRGNAKQWPDDARAAGIPTGSTPRVGSVAIMTTGFYGHAMWVEAVNGNMVYVSQYNYDLAGHYSEMWVNGSSFTYIYFR
jgi:surface antigen